MSQVQSNWIETLKAQRGEITPPPTHDTISTNTISDVADATIAILQLLRVPNEHFSFAQAIVGAADGSVDWFECKDRELGARALDEDTRSTEAVKKWVQRRRDAWCEWQDSIGFVLIECAPGGKKGEEFLGSKYRAHILSFIHDCLDIARAELQGKGSKNRAEAFKKAAWAILPPAIKRVAEARSRHERFNRPRKGPEANINKAVKMALTYLRKAVEEAQASGGDPSTLINNHIQAAQQLVPGSVHTKEHKNIYGHRGEPVPIVPLESETVDTCVHPLDEVPTVDTCVHPLDEVPTVDTCVHPLDEVPTVDTYVHPLAESSPPVSLNPIPMLARNTGGDVGKALEAFASVGVCVFKVLFKDDQARVARVRGDFDDLSLARHLPELIGEAEKLERSLIIDVKGSGKRIIQVDECGPEALELLAPFSFLQIETSKGNGQSWIALPEDTADEICGDVIARLFIRLKSYGANRGASGGLRWPGSVNFKPARDRFRVRIERAALQRIVSPLVLEAAGLLPPFPAAQGPLQRPQASRNNGLQSFPDYSKCLASKDGDRSKADASFLKIAQLRGFTRDAACAELERVSERAKEERARGRKDYVTRTASFVQP